MTTKEALVKWVNDDGREKPTLAHVVRLVQEEKSQLKVAEAKEVLLYGQFPPIDKMDASISTLVSCEYDAFSTAHSARVHSSFSSRKLSLSTNMIEKIANLNGLSKHSVRIHHRSPPRPLEHLKILSLGRNLIKNLVGLVSTIVSKIAERPFRTRLLGSCWRHTGRAVDFVQSNREVERHRRNEEAQSSLHEQQRREGLDRISEAGQSHDIDERPHHDLF